MERVERMTVALPAGLAASRVETGTVQPRLLKTAVLRAQLLRLALRGLTARQASEVVGCGYWAARAAYADPGFRAQVLGRVEGALAYADEKFGTQARSLHARLAEKSEHAFEKLAAMLDDPNVHTGLQVKIGLAFLDRNPETAGVKLTGAVGDYRQTPEDLMLAAKTAEEMNRKVVPIRREA